ncbi:hypothetical protein PVK06_001124 [Gossypium arboreum]|uniref:Retropepsins domain-containing protein n=1 Tax=Gossypium arboreum TaxID=29729 RepID=A0ABR0R078_GOSAR|nr:hypothetical protein PVK06_001124 [Gossypium arboreum]
MEKSGIKIQDDDDIESVCSIEDQPSEKTICAIPVYDSASYSESDYSDSLMIQAKVQSRTIDRSIGEAISAPHIPVKIYLDKYSKPITIIAFIDTGAAETIMNPDVLPTNWWKPHTRIFESASNVLLITRIISKPITIQFFPNCSITTTVLGSKLPGKDIVIGFDLYKKAQYLRILPQGIRYKNLFQPFVKIPKLFLIKLEKIIPIIQNLKAQSCAKSHSEFLKKCPNPLWKNPDFFIQLPFKKNEDINHTKWVKNFISSIDITKFEGKIDAYI